ncbi:hypothetical protein ACFL6B_00070 [Thermodesulfobacteriota bacterium]
MGRKISSLLRLKESVIRRAVIVVLLTMPGFVLNYALYLGAGKLLDIKEFGIFYTAISFLNFLSAPAVFVGFFYSRQITKILTFSGIAPAINEFRGIISLAQRWGGLGTIALFITLLILGHFFGVKSLILIILLVLTNYGNYLVEAVRIGFQGLQMFIWFGIASLVWMMLRFTFSMAGLYFGGSVWSGVLGILLSTIPIFFGSYHLITRQAPVKSILVPRLSLNGRHLLKILASFGAFATIMYIDVLQAYISMDETALGIYSASSVLPKSIIIISMPAARVLFPIMVSTQSTGQSQKKNVLKGLLLSFLLSGAGAAILILFDELFCNSSIGINSCNPALMSILACSAIPICLLRVMVLLQFARGLDWHPLLLVFPVTVYLGYVTIAMPDTNDFAWTYLAFLCITLAIYAAACLKWSTIWNSLLSILAKYRLFVLYK